MKVGENVTNFIFQKLGMNGQQVALVVDKKQMESLPKVSGGEPYLSRETNEVFKRQLSTLRKWATNLYRWNIYCWLYSLSKARFHHLERCRDD